MAHDIARYIRCAWTSDGHIETAFAFGGHTCRIVRDPRTGDILESNVPPYSDMHLCLMQAGNPHIGDHPMTTALTSPYGDHLPIFPCLDYSPISEDRIERAVERLFDRADDALLAGKATQEQYNKWTARLADWADEQYRKIA